MLQTPRVNLTESWRWEVSSSFGNLQGLDGGVVSGNGDIFAIGSPSIISGLSDSSSFFSETEPSERFSVFKISGEAGEEIWEYEGGTENGIDRAYGVGVDAGGNVIVGGSTTGNWSEPTDSYYNSESTNGTQNNSGPQQLAAFKLDGNDKTELWRYQLETSQLTSNTTSETGWATAGKIMSIAVDTAGDALFVGHVWEDSVNGSDSNYIVGKLDGANGSQLWAFQGGLNGSFEAFWACELDSKDNLVAAGLKGGEAANNLSDSNYFVVKFDAEDGEEQWSWESDVPNGKTLLAVTIDSEDGVYVAGGKGMQTVDSDIASAAIVVKLDGCSGDEIWRYPDSSSDHSSVGTLFRSVAVDDDSGIVVAVGVTGDSDYNPSISTTSPTEQTATNFDFLAIALNATTGEYLGTWEGIPLDYEIYFAFFHSDGSLFLGGYSSEISESIVTKFQPEGYVLPADSGRAGREWMSIFGVVAVSTVVFAFCLTYAFCRIRRTIYLSKTVEDFGPVFRHNASSLGALPSAVATSRPVPLCQSRPIWSFNISVSDLMRKDTNWALNTSGKDLKRKEDEGTSRGTLCDTSLFSITPDSPKGFAPKYPPEQDAPKRPDDELASPTIINGSFEEESYPEFVVQPIFHAGDVQPPKYTPPPAYTREPGVNESELDMAVQLKLHPRLKKNDSASGSVSDVENAPTVVIKNHRGFLDSSPKRYGKIDTPTGDTPTGGSRCKQGNEYTSSFETRNGLSTHLFPGVFWSSLDNAEAALRNSNLFPYQSKFSVGSTVQRDPSPRVSPPVAQNGRTDSDSASAFGGDKERAAARNPQIPGNERNVSEDVAYVRHPTHDNHCGLAGRDKGIATTAIRPPYFRRSSSFVESNQQEEISRENLHRVESWVTKTTVFPKEPQKKYLQKIQF